MSSERFTPLWPEVEQRIAATQPRRRLPKPNAKGWIGPLCSPLREDKHPSFSIKPDSETDPGAWKDHATGESGSMADLARRLGIAVGGNRRIPPTPEAPSPQTFADFTRARHLNASPLLKAGVREVVFGDRPALRYPTPRGVDRNKFLDRGEPKYSWATKGGSACWYGLRRAKAMGGPLVYLVNGEPLVWACSQENVPAVCLCAGEGTPPTPELVAELAASGFTRVSVVYDLDDAGRNGAPLVVEALRAGGVDAQAYELPADLGEHGDVDDLHRRTGSNLRAALVSLPVLRVDGGNSKDATQSQTLVRLSEQAEYFHTPDGDAYAVIPRDEHSETWQVKWKTLKQWLVRLFLDLNDKPPSNQALQDALGVMESTAQFRGDACQVFTRLAALNDAVYLDLANEAARHAERTRPSTTETQAWHHADRRVAP